MTTPIANTALAADFNDIDRWWDQRGVSIAAVVSQGYTLTARLGTRYLRAHAALEGVQIDPVEDEVNVEQIATALLVAGPVAFKKNIRKTADPLLARRVMADSLRGASNRLVMAGGRDGTTGTAMNNDGIRGWRRVAGGSPCAFCAMLVSRGAVYKERTALRSPEFHDHDRCTYEPVYVNEPEPPEVLFWQRQWEESTDGFSGLDALNAFRRHLRGEGLGTDVE